MLQELYIQNFAIIDSVRLTFDKNFNVITGETGAGKSIVINALSLLLGSKASSDQIRTGVNKAIIEAVFEIPDQHTMWEKLSRIGITKEADRTVILRREVSDKGRSRCFINDVGVTLHSMTNAIKGIIVLHGQHQQQVLLDLSNHLAMLDRFAGLWENRLELNDLHSRLQTLLKKRDRLIIRERELAQRKDLIDFQIKEIEGANIVSGEEKELLREQKILSSAQHYIELLQKSYFQLYESDDSLLGSLSLISSDLEEAVEIDENLDTLYRNFTNSYYQLQEVAETLRISRDNVETDPARLDFILSRLDELRTLKRKYGDTIENVLEYKDSISREQIDNKTYETKLEELNESLEQTASLYKDIATNLSVKRKAAAPEFCDKMEKELRELGMKSIKFSVDFLDAYTKNFSLTAPLEISPEGFEQVILLIAPNVGEEPKPVAKIASGGEISRIMLAFRTIIADIDEIETLVFDEVDVGIGGHIAKTVAEKLTLIARTHQVLCITHLPQIASMSSCHIKVHKEVIEGRTYAKIICLSDEERVSEIARMLDGEAASELSKDHAAELLLTKKKGA